MSDFLHLLLRRSISRESLPEENDWDALLGIEFIVAQLLSLTHFMEKTEFRTKTMRAAEGRINDEKEKSKKSKTDVIAGAVLGDMSIPHVDQGRVCIRCVCAELLKHPTFCSDLVVGLLCFDYLCCLRYPRNKLWIVMPGCYRASVFVVGWPSA